MAKRYQQWSSYAFMLLAIGAAFLLLFVSVIFKTTVFNIMTNVFSMDNSVVVIIASSMAVFVAFGFYVMLRLFFKV